MSSYARQERQALCDLLLERGPDAPTLCEGWTTRDLAAHLVLRERRPDAAVGILVAPLRGRTERVQAELRDARRWPELVDAVRSGPPAVMRLLDEQVNTVELFAHHEDVRRAQDAPWEPRTLDAGEEQVLWSRLRWLARIARRRVPVGLTLVAPGFGELRVRPGEPHVTLTGAPGELLLFMTGRQRAASVDAAGPAEAVARARDAKLGL